MDVQIKSDGTIGGTVVKINGKTITESGNIVSVNFNADIGEKWAYINYELRGVDKDGVSRVVSYRVSPESTDHVMSDVDTTRANELLDIDRSVGDEEHKVVTIDRSKIDRRFIGAYGALLKDSHYTLDNEDDTKDEDIDSIDNDILSQILDDDYLNNDQESLEARFASCKKSISGSESKSFAVCSYLNPKISPKRRAQLKVMMAKNRKK